MEHLIEVDCYAVRSVLDVLLQDKTTKQNIIWATNSYREIGEQYRDSKQITVGSLKGLNPIMLQPRVLKALEQQQQRTKSHAEVFTPSWICNLMNNLCDEEWFGCKDMFNVQTDNKWERAESAFPKGKKWQSYVDLRRLEITCGEAPYLVSRYDTGTGEIIPTSSRIGLLDRKLRVVDENTDSEEEWFKWVLRAFQSIYGYEYQGDNLLIARINLLMSFADYYEEKWHKAPDYYKLKKIANVIAWNLWQMDGLSDTVPLGGMGENEGCYQFSLFEGAFESDTDNSTQAESIMCKIHDWRADKTFLYKALKTEKGEKRIMKFDFVIGNPPYQESISTSEENVALSKQLFPNFIELSIKVSSRCVALITPSRWFAGDAQDKSFVKLRKFMKENNHIKCMYNYKNAREVFQNAEIKGGGKLLPL